MSDEVKTDAIETPQPPLDGENVHIHRPKPLHGVRELLAEVGVIVIGIIIAIGLEQSVEYAHRAAQVQEAREALAREHKYNSAAFQILTEEEYLRVSEIKKNMLLFSYLRSRPSFSNADWRYSWANLNTTFTSPLQNAAWKNAERNNIIQFMPNSEADRYRREYVLIDFIIDKGDEEISALYDVRRPIIVAGYSGKFTASEIDEELHALSSLLLLYIYVGQRQRNLAGALPDYRHAPDDRISAKAAFNHEWLDQHTSQERTTSVERKASVLGEQLRHLYTKFYQPNDNN